MRIESAIVLVTGANRGIGLTFARSCCPEERARSTPVRATPRRCQAGVQALQLDVTKPDDVAAAGRRTDSISQARNDGSSA